MKVVSCTFNWSGTMDEEPHWRVNLWRHSTAWMVHSVRGFRQPTRYEGVVTCMVRVPELPQRAPMWTAASWKTNGRQKGGLVHQDLSLFFMDSCPPPRCLYRSQPPPDRSSCPSAAHNCMIYLLSLIHSSFALPLFWQISTVSFKPYPALAKTSSSLSLSALVSCLFASEGASQLGVWGRYRTYVNTPCL